MRKAWMVLTLLLLLVLPSLHSFGGDSKSRSPKEPKYGSKRPLYFRVVFGKEGKPSMLGVIDESGGTGTGYDTAYVDENMDNDLTNEDPKKFPVRTQRVRLQTGAVSSRSIPDPRFDFKGPLGEKGSADYTLNIYSLRYQNRAATPTNKYYFFWYLRAQDWNYFLINGQMPLYSTAADALKGEPVRLGGPCKWEINSQMRDKNVLVSAGLKDENGSTLRSLAGPSGPLSPELTLLEDGKTVKQEKMTFG
jgi:hypothetical protein